MQKFSNEDLIKYAEGQLGQDEVPAVEAWLAGNPAARQLVNSWRAVRGICRQDDSVAPPASLTTKLQAIFRAVPVQQRESWFSKLQHVIASLTFDSRLQPLAVRSAAAEMVELSFEAEGIEVDLQCTLGDSTEDRWTVMGQVSSAAAPARVALCDHESGQPVAEAVVDGRGMFKMQCDPGVFVLIIEIEHAAVRTPPFELI